MILFGPILLCFGLFVIAVPSRDEGKAEKTARISAGILAIFAGLAML